MPLVIPEGYGEATITIAVQGRSAPVSTTLGYLPSAPSDDPTTAAGNIADAFGAPNSFGDAPRMGTAFQYLGVSVHQNVDGLIVGGDATRNVVGTRSDTFGPVMINSSLVVQKRTGFIGRHYRGRMYIPCMVFGESQVDIMGQIDPTAYGFAQNCANAFFAALGDNDITPMLLHYSVAVGPTIPPTAITAFSVAGQVGTQRRRFR